MKSKHMVLLLTFIACISFFSFRSAEKAVETKKVTAAKATIDHADYNAGTYIVHIDYDGVNAQANVSVSYPFAYDCLWNGDVTPTTGGFNIDIHVWSTHGYVNATGFVPFVTH